MQSGHANAVRWVLEFEPETPRSIEPLMGYTSSADMRSQIRLQFDSRDEAVAYAERNDIAYRVHEPKDRKRGAMSYSDNFRHNRAQPWSH